MCLLLSKPCKNIIHILLTQLVGISGAYSTLHAQNIQYNLNCTGGPGQAQFTVESPLGAEWSYALDGDDFQASNSFFDVFPGNHWLFVQNSSGDVDSIRFSANCGLKTYSCTDCDESGAFFQVYTENGSIAGLSIETNQFSNLPNSPAGFHINAIGMNPTDSLGYGMKRRFSNELIVVDAQGTAINLGSVQNLPAGDYTGGDFDADGYLHIKEGFSNELFKIDVKSGEMIERYQLNRNLRTNDIAFNTVDGLFYSVDNDGTLWSFSSVQNEVLRIGSSFLSGPVGAMYCDRTGRVFGIHNSTGRLYQFSLIDGSATFIMTTSSSSYNDGFSCQNIFLINLPEPVIEVECSSDSDRVSIAIVEPTGDDLEFSVNSSPFESRRGWSDLPVGQSIIEVRRQESCISDSIVVNLMPIFSTNSAVIIEACDEFVSPSGIRWTDSGNYRDTILNSMGCDSIISYDLTILESSSSSRSVVTCDTYTWNGMSLDSSGVYDFLTTNTAGCDSIARLNLEIRPFLDTQLNITSCRPINSPVGQEVFDTSGTYIDTLISALGCDSIVTVNLLIADVAAEWQLADPECPDRVVSELLIDTLTHQAPHYLIRNNRDSTLISSLPFDITDLPPGEHEIQFISADSCQSPSYTIEIEELTLPEIQLIGPSEVDICDPPSFFQVETNLSGSYQWYSSSSLLCDTCQSTEVFSFQEGPVGVEFTDDNNCTATAEIDLTVTGRDAQYFIPNVFTPNGDGINDYFTLFGKQGGVDQIELLEIYDRWGNRLFETQNIAASIESQGWNGWYRGQPMSTGVYAYRIIYQYCDGTRYRLHGTVTLVR